MNRLLAACGEKPEELQEIIICPIHSHLASSLSIQAPVATRQRQRELHRQPKLQALTRSGRESTLCCPTHGFHLHPWHPKTAFWTQLLRSPFSPRTRNKSSSGRVLSSCHSAIHWY